MEESMEIMVTPIGVMCCGLQSPAEAPMNYTEYRQIVVCIPLVTEHGNKSKKYQEGEKWKSRY